MLMAACSICSLQSLAVCNEYDVSLLTFFLKCEIQTRFIKKLKVLYWVINLRFKQKYKTEKWNEK